MRETIDTTYADLRPSDLVIDKSGQAWPIDAISSSEDGTTIFWLCDPVSKARAHLISKQSGDAVKVSRLPTQAAEASKLEADFPVPEGRGPRSPVDWSREDVAAQGISPESDLVIMTNDAASIVTEVLGGTVEAEVTAEEVDAAAAATDDAPLTIIPFADMTPLEARSHLFLCHGVYGHDLQGKAELAALHDQAHAATTAGTLNSRHVPHVHEVK